MGKKVNCIKKGGLETIFNAWEAIIPEQIHKLIFFENILL